MKTGTLFLIFLFLLSFGCGEKKKEDSKVNNELKIISSDTASNNKADNKPGERNLRYLFFSKAGLRGFYSDGTIGLCPKCDFTLSNVDGLKDMGVFGKYTVEKDGSLLLNGHDKETPVYTGNLGADWALIDYVWKIRPAN